MSMALQRGDVSYDLLQRLRSDKAGGWTSTFGDQLPKLCERLVEELEEVGVLRDEPDREWRNDEFEDALGTIFEEGILPEDEDRDVRLSWLRTVESKCRQARAVLGLPPTDLRL